MHSNSVFALALSASTALAAPSFPVTVKSHLYSRDGPDNCEPTLGDQKYVTNLGWYSEKDCNDKIGFLCLYTYEGTLNGNPGDWSCAAAHLPDTTPFYAKTEDTPKDKMQVVFTRDQSCPPNGPGAVFASLIDNASCVEMNLGGDAPGVTVFPNGGSGISRVANSNGAFESVSVEKRDGPKCDGFTIEEETASSSETVQVSNIVDCVNGGETDCTITVGQEHTKSVTTSYSLSAGGGLEGVFSVEATFGQEFTESSTTSIQEGFSVPAGQKGYLSAYSAATLFKGKFTGCDSGDAEQPGQALVIKKNGFTYAVVLTGSK